MLNRTSTTLSDGTRLEDLVNVDAREVSMRVLSDPEIYQLEMERIFGRTWLVIAHETEIPKPGDFVVRPMGEDSVIVARDRSGEVFVSLNVCPHRGMKVCTTETGNALVHRCIYHGWAFRPNGDFIGAPVEREQMHGNIYNKQQLGLRKARVQLYGGLVFATWNLDGPSLEEFFGDFKWYYDSLFCRTEGGLAVLGPPQRFVLRANWKTASEQSASDGFHTLTLHRSLMDAGVMGNSGGDAVYDTAPGMYGVDVGSPHGHSLRCIPAETTFTMFMGRSDISSLSWEERLRMLPPPGITPAMIPQMIKQLSPEQLQLMAKAPPQVISIFPNVLILFIYAPRTDGGFSGVMSLHTYVPRGPNHIEFCNWLFAEKSAPEQMKRDMLENGVRQLGTSGTIEQDDSDTWPVITKNAHGAMGRHQTLKYQALTGVNKPADWPGGGLVYEGFTKDDTQWNWWLYWHELMTKSV